MSADVTKRAKSFLASLTEDERLAFQRAGRVRRFKTGEILFHEGDMDGDVFALVGGRVKVSIAGLGGREVMLQVAGPGELVGELAAVSGRPHSATVVALDEVEVIALAAEAFRHFVSTQPRVARLIFARITEMLSLADRQLVDLATRDVTGRVAARLLDLAGQADASEENIVPIPMSLSQDELAAWTGASREAVAKSLRLLRELGWVQTRRREIIVLNRVALRSLVG